MDSAHDLHGGLISLATAMRLGGAAELDHLLETLRASRGAEDEVATPQYLLYSRCGVGLAVPLTALREVLPGMPTTTPLPFSPNWLLGIFPLRNEILGLVDPAPVLFPQMDVAEIADYAVRTAIVVGSDERALAWAVDTVGEIVQVADADLAALERLPERLRDTPHYAIGSIRREEPAAEYVVLDAQAALTGMLEALQESDEPHD